MPLTTCTLKMRTDAFCKAINDLGLYQLRKDGETLRVKLLTGSHPRCQLVLGPGLVWARVARRCVRAAMWNVRMHAQEC